MSIEVIDNFTVNAAKPIDDRMIANTYDAMLAIPANRRWPGMRVYNLDLPLGLNRRYWELRGSVNANPIHNDNWVPVTNAVVNAVIDCGNWDPNSGIFPTTGGTGDGGAIKRGNLFFVNVAGSLFGVDYTVGDSIRARVDNPTNDNADWIALEGNIGYVPENVARKRTNLGSPNDNDYPTTKAVNDAIQYKESTNNKATTFATINDTLYPTTKAVNDNYESKLINIDNLDADFTPVLADLRRWKRFTGSVTRTITLPSDATLNLPIGFTFTFSQAGTGIVQWVAGSGATVNAGDTATKLRVQFAPAQAIKVAANTWLVIGDITV